MVQPKVMKMAYVCGSAFSVPWAANWATASPHGGKLLAVVGDDPMGLVLDTTTGDRVAQLKGHLDYSFAAAWHPGGVYLATANQVTWPPCRRCLRTGSIGSPWPVSFLGLMELACCCMIGSEEQNRF